MGSTKMSNEYCTQNGPQIGVIGAKVSLLKNADAISSMVIGPSEFSLRWSFD